MKKFCLIALVSLASTAALAQAPAGTLTRPAHESNATKSGGPAAEKAQMKTDDRKDATTAMGAGPKSGRWSAMDANADGMVSQEEYMAFHATRWGKMKHTNGSMPMADMEAAMSSGPN